MADPETIDIAEAAHYILHHTGEPGDWYPPGSFYRALIDAALRADPYNLDRLGEGFPILVDALKTWRRYGPGPLRFLIEQAKVG